MTEQYSFYLPFYFQAVRGSSATSSGIRMIPLVLPQILAIMLVGGIVTKFGVYVRFPSILLLGKCS